MNFIDLLNIKEDILKNDGNQFLVPIDSSYSVFFSYYGSHGAQQLSDYQYCSKYIILHSTAE